MESFLKKSIMAFAVVTVAWAPLAQANSCQEGVERIILEKGKCKTFTKWDVICQGSGFAESGGRVKIVSSGDEGPGVRMEIENLMFSVKVGEGSVRDKRLRELFQAMEDTKDAGKNCSVDLCVAIDNENGVGVANIKSSSSSCDSLNRINLFK